MSKYTRIEGAPERIEQAVDDLIEAVQQRAACRPRRGSADGWLAVKAVVLCLLADLADLEHEAAR